MSFNNTYAVVMAGGGGTRLWPLSRQSRPKQSIPLVDERTLFQMALERLQPDLPAERVLVVTVPAYAEMLMEQVEALSSAHFLVEPRPRGTAAAIGYAAVALHARDPEAVMLCLTADHIIRNELRFRELLAAAGSLAAQGDLVTLGITPDFPSTGYGYIQVGDPVGEAGGFQSLRVLSFKEKPDLELAQMYVESGDYCWNSGMFVWRTDRILSEIERLMPELHSGLIEISQALGSPEAPETVQRVWDRLQPQTIDYGVMEKAEGVVVILADDLEWSDIGGWDRMAEIIDGDEDGNLIAAQSILLRDTSRTLIFRGESEARKLITTLGVEDLIIVDTEDVLLVCHRDQAEGVRQLVATLSETGMKRYL